MIARSIHKLSDPAVKAAKLPGRYSDGGGLYLNVSARGARSWLFMWTPAGGKRREMGLGGYPAVTLARARAKASDCREIAAGGGDPIVERDKTPEKTFGEAADEFISSIESEWRNKKHRWQWQQTLRDRCAAIRGKLVSQVTTEDVLKVLKPMWTAQPETAARLRGRIERVLNFAKVKGWRSGENPAAWRDNLRNILPKQSKLARGHYAAMPYPDLPAFMTDLRAVDGPAARALEVTILTASRSGEAIGMRWDELDLDAALWTVPASRMKAGEEHLVPLTARVVVILRKLAETAVGPHVFPSPAAKHKPLSNMAMMMLMRRMKHGDLTVHGFRSTFRDWCGDQTTFPREVAEAALAHKVGNAVEQAYRRSSALEKRRKLMDAWSRYCSATGQKKGTLF
ncbi:MAG: integrase arm-type DNA-binding domain-containing protein [Devosia sp.]